MDESADVSRRAILRGVAGATAATTAAGTAAAQEGEGGDGEGGGDGGGGGTERPVWPGYVSDAREGGYEDHRGEGSATVQVGSGDEGLTFSPTQLWIDPGTEVTFEWVSNGHNVLPESQPDDAEWEGHQPLEDEGFTYSHTFEGGGMYPYFCQPHEGLGMKGAIAVGDDVETESVGGEGGGGGPDVPDAAKSIGIAAGFAMAATLGLAYFFIKYGGNYRESETA